MLLGFGLFSLLAGLTLRRAYPVRDFTHPDHERDRHQPTLPLLSNSVEGILAAAATGLIWVGAGFIFAWGAFAVSWLIP
jgi:hypothetical protein